MKRQFMHVKPSSGQHSPAASHPGAEVPQQAVSVPPQVGAPPGSGQKSLSGSQQPDFATMPVSQHHSGIGAFPAEENNPLSSPFVSPNASNGPVPSPFVKPSISNGPSLFMKPGASNGPVPSPFVNPNTSNGPVPSPFGNASRAASPASKSNNGFSGGGAPAQQIPPFASPFANPSMSGVPQTPRPQTGNLNPGPMSIPGAPGSMPSMSGIQAPPLIPQGLSPRAPGQLPQTPVPPQPPKGTDSKKKKRRFPIWARVLVAVMTVLVAIAGAGFWYYQVNFASSVNQIAGHKATTFDKNGKKTEENSQSTNSNGDMLSGGRVNILLLGSDNDGKGNDGKSGAPLAQTDIVVTIDPSTNYVGMLSIPRDLRVTIPGYGAGKMDWAFSYGYQSNASDDHYADAAGLAIATVKTNFNIDINYYAWVGLDGFIKVIDTAGGVDFEALHPMVDDIYPNDIKTEDIYGYKRLYIAPGPQHMNGIEALEYVRTRHSDLGGDFGRSVRQQQILTALKGKLQSSETVTKLPEYAKDLTGYLQTDMEIPDVVKMANYARTIDASKINKLVLSPPYSQSIDGTDYAPICSVILPDLQKMFGNTAGCQSVLGSKTPALSEQDKLLAKYNPSHVNANTSLGTLASAQQMASSSTMDVPQMLNDPFGIRSLMDLMFMVTFESVKV